jgi:hypothetical protein
MTSLVLSTLASDRDLAVLLLPALLLPAQLHIACVPVYAAPDITTNGLNPQHHK